MQKFTLDILFKIIGIGSASGLIYNDNFLYIISDNSTFLYHYDIKESKVSKIKLFENSQENLRKRDKSDFESVLQKDKKIYLFGSGSKPKRQTLATYDPKKEIATKTDLSEIYDAFRKAAQMPKEELNIEGVVYYDQQWIFFQRGNGKQGKNGIFILKNKKLMANQTITYIPIVLPSLKNVAATFTDAVLVKDKIYFLAAGEDSNSTYKDGEIVGSIIGCLDAKKFTIDFTQTITETQKFEGLTLYKNTKEQIEFLLCEDNDTEALESTVYKLILKK
ncbi:DUF6929 family protein [Flavobacterium sp.]|uniref:DUF6929 family protein n=1 Tax=Flavobacterium sp. TaxID=239 RepID=UPI00286B6E99|nr:hypothetical protein [Flavobacterium sp.]